MPEYRVKTTGLTLNGAHLQPGEVVTLSERSGAAGIKDGLLEALEIADAKIDAERLDGAPTPDAAEEVEKIRKALDAKYNREEGGQKPGLAEAAKAAGIEFAYNASKDEIIQAVIDAGNPSAFL